VMEGHCFSVSVKAFTRYPWERHRVQLRVPALAQAEQVQALLPEQVLADVEELISMFALRLIDLPNGPRCLTMDGAR